MGLLINGQWVDQWYDTKKTGGHFVRQDSQFRHLLGSKDFPVEKNRYCLYVSYACPWAHRTLIYRKLKQLDQIIPVINVSPLMLKFGWEFENGSDQINHKSKLYEIYTQSDPNYSGRVTVPILWDMKTKQIVNNESSDIIRMFNSEFNELTGHYVDYYPRNLATQIDELNDYIYKYINNGVYKVGFATDQSVYDEEVQQLFKALDLLDDRLSHQQFLFGAQITESDWRLFTTLIRFDIVYVGHFKCNIRRIKDYQHLSRFLNDLISQDGIKETIKPDEIKSHYYRSHPQINPNGIVAFGPVDSFYFN
tara:strand:+ start:618 stop:1538 length:921 start_codon:yes stop_codon:yes gene_type:complete